LSTNKPSKDGNASEFLFWNSLFFGLKRHVSFNGFQSDSYGNKEH